MEAKAKYQVDDLLAGLDRAVLRVLTYHVGREQAISRADLVANVRFHGFDLDERVVRACINQLRKDGKPICSAGGRDGGYWLAKDWHELNEYRERELRSRAFDLLEQDRALEAAGEALWGKFSPGVQGRLF